MTRNHNKTDGRLRNQPNMCDVVENYSHEITKTQRYTKIFLQFFEFLSLGGSENHVYSDMRAFKASIR